MDKKKKYILKLATTLHSQGKKMTGQKLADNLNKNNFLTSYGTKYQGGRGTYKLIRETWNCLENKLNQTQDAKIVAETFVKANGAFAYN
jgi:hypothetical protein